MRVKRAVPAAGEVAGFRVIDALLELDLLDQLGDEAVDVEEAVQVNVVPWLYGTSSTQMEKSVPWSRKKPRSR